MTYTVNGQPYEGYYVSPECAGAAGAANSRLGRPDRLRDQPRRHALAEKGYTVFAADLFGKGVTADRSDDKRQHTGELYKDREKCAP